MTIKTLNIVPPKFVEAAQTSQYAVQVATVGLNRTVVDKMTVSNISASAVTFSCNIVAVGAPGNNNLIRPPIIIEPGEVYQCPEIVGHVLNQSTFISTLASAANALVLMISGREINYVA